MSAPVDLDALEQAVAAMSSGPWALDPTDDDIIAPDDAVKHPDGSTGNVVGYLYVEQDWNGIVALRNAAPALIAEISALRAEASDLHHDIDSLRRLLAEAKRLGLEACEFIHSAISNAPDANSTDLGDMSASAMGHNNADRIAAALEAL